MCIFTDHETIKGIMKEERPCEIENRGDRLHVKENEVLQTSRGQRVPAEGTKAGTGTERGEELITNDEDTRERKTSI